MRLLFVSIAVVLSASSYAATPAENAIRKAQVEIAKQPAHFPYYNSLAMAYARRARETSDVQFYAKAEDTLERSFAISPGNFEGLKVEAWLQLGRHEFAKALETATALNKKTPDDIAVYGYLVDANVELGRYPAAVDAAQWMLDLRPGNVAGLTRAAYLRELHGNLAGALDLMQMAYDSTPYSETEDRAWLMTQMAHLHLMNDDLPKAEAIAASALNLFPGYHYALGTLAQIRIRQTRYEDAVALLRDRYRSAAHAENLYALAEALELAGHAEEAKRAFAEFLPKSLAESTLADNSNHELIAYYLDHGHDPAKALAIAQREVERRQDIYTLDSYARALAANGDYEAASDALRKATKVGTKDPKILAHAREIAAHVERADSAKAR